MKNIISKSAFAGFSMDIFETVSRSFTPRYSSDASVSAGPSMRRWMVALIRYKDVIAIPNTIPAMLAIVSKLSRKYPCVANLCIVPLICRSGK